MKSFCVKTASKGFTLVEIALAVGIFAFAIVAIMALFPVGLQNANDSRIETQVAQISRTVMSDLRTPPLYRLVTHPGPPVLPSTNEAIMKDGKHMGSFQAALVAIKDPFSNKAESAFQMLDLSLPSTIYLAYTSDGKTRGETNATTYSSGFKGADPSVGFIIKIDSKLVVSSVPQLAQITLSIETPAVAPVVNRSKYSVVTLIGNTR